MIILQNTCTGTEPCFGQNFVLYFQFLKCLHGAVGIAVLCQNFLDKKVHAMKKFCSVACKSRATGVQKLVNEGHLFHFDVDSPTDHEVKLCN